MFKSMFLVVVILLTVTAASADGMFDDQAFDNIKQFGKDVQIESIKDQIPNFDLKDLYPSNLGFFQAMYGKLESEYQEFNQELSVLNTKIENIADDSECVKIVEDLNVLNEDVSDLENDVETLLSKVEAYDPQPGGEFEVKQDILSQLSPLEDNVHDLNSETSIILATMETACPEANENELSAYEEQYNELFGWTVAMTENLEETKANILTTYCEEGQEAANEMKGAAVFGLGFMGAAGQGASMQIRDELIELGDAEMAAKFDELAKTFEELNIQIGELAVMELTSELCLANVNVNLVKSITFTSYEVKAGNSLLVMVELNKLQGLENVKVTALVPGLGLETVEFVTFENEQETTEMFLQVPQCTTVGAYETIVEIEYGLVSETSLYVINVLEDETDTTCSVQDPEIQDPVEKTEQEKLNDFENLFDEYTDDFNDYKDDMKDAEKDDDEDEVDDIKDDLKNLYGDVDDLYDAISVFKGEVSNSLKDEVSDLKDDVKKLKKKINCVVDPDDHSYCDTPVNTEPNTTYVPTYNVPQTTPKVVQDDTEEVVVVMNEVQPQFEDDTPVTVKPKFTETNTYLALLISGMVLLLGLVFFLGAVVSRI